MVGPGLEEGEGIVSPVVEEASRRLGEISREREAGLEGRPTRVALPSNFPRLPDEESRRLWLNQQLDLIEDEVRTIFDEGRRGMLEEVIQANLRISNLDAEDRAKKIKEYIQEIRARWWLQNLTQNMMNGEFGEALKFLRYINQFLPVIYNLPGVAKALKEYENGDYNVFRQPAALQLHFNQNLAQQEDVRPVGQRLAERILHSLGVSVTASLSFNEDAPEFKEAETQVGRSLTRVEMLDKLKSLPWERQVEIIQLKESFEAQQMPFDLRKVLFYGYHLEKAAADEVKEAKGKGFPKAMPKMRQNMLFPTVMDYLRVAKRDIDKDGPTKGLGERWQADVGIPTVEQLVERMSAMSNFIEKDFYEQVVFRQDITPPSKEEFEKMTWKEQANLIDIPQTLAVADTTKGENPTGTGFIWALRLLGYKAVISDLEKGFMGNPSIAGAVEALQSTNQLLRPDKEVVVRTVAANLFEYLTESRAAYFSGPNLSKEAAAAIFEVLTDKGLLTHTGEENLKRKYLGPKWWRNIKMVKKLVDVNGAILAFIKQFFKEISQGLGK